MKRTEEKKRVCYLCGSPEITLHFPGKRQEGDTFRRAFLITDSDYQSYPDIYRCGDCGLIFSDPHGETAAPLPYYRAMTDPEYQREAEGRSRPFQRILNELARYHEPGVLLDVGAATGIFLVLAGERGWTVRGVEPSSWAVEEARTLYGLDIFCGTVEEAVFPNDHFRAVILLDVLEHVSEPLALLEELRRILEPEGMLVLTTPDIGSAVARYLGPRWWHVRRAHQYYFNQKSLHLLLQKAGFKVVRRKYYPWAFSLHYWISRFEHFYNPAYRLLRRLENTALGRKIRNQVIKLNFFDSFELYLRKSGGHEKGTWVSRPAP